MKKGTIILTSALMLFSAFAFANDGDLVNEKVKAAFIKDFSVASNVTWEKTNDYFFASFVINQIEINAAYDEDGELVGISRVMETAQLPIPISMALAKKYTGYTIGKKAIELSYEGNTHYYFTVVNEKQTLKLKCTVNGSIEVERRIKHQ